MLYNIVYTKTAVIYPHSTVITKISLLYNTEWWYDHGMVVNYRGKSFITLGPGGKSWLISTILICHSWMIIEWDFLKQSYPFNLSYHPTLSCHVPLALLSNGSLAHACRQMHVQAWVMHAPTEIGLECTCFVVLVNFFPHLNMQNTCWLWAPTTLRTHH